MWGCWARSHLVVLPLQTMDLGISLARVKSPCVSHAGNVSPLSFLIALRILGEQKRMTHTCAHIWSSKRKLSQSQSHHWAVKVTQIFSIGGEL